MAANRTVTVSSPLGDDVLQFLGMSAAEELGRLFEYRVDLLSDDHNIALNDVVGQGMTVKLLLASGGTRFFHGCVSEFAYVGSAGRRARYRAELRPWLWFLTRTTDCRAFQDMTVPDIVMQVFRDHQFADFDDKLEEKYRTREYCVQYRESAFDFVSRLMEEEGIYYSFRHEDGKHTLVLADARGAHGKVEGYDKIPFHDLADAAVHEHEHVSSWTVSHTVQAGAYAHTDYDFGRPDANLLERQQEKRDHAHGEYEVFDYPGGFVVPGEGDPDAGADLDQLTEIRKRYARIRLEELQARYEGVRGTANARGLTTGSLFELTDYPRKDQNREYLAVAATFDLKAESYESGRDAGNGDATFTCSFTAIDAKQPYRSPRRTPKAVVRGPQTARVVGQDGELVWTDKFGRVKVKFHWDRHGKDDGTSSCWVRVSQHWAGNNWGATHLPHIGQEVVVDFLEGDPDRPLITGRVNNRKQMPCDTLPTHKLRSILRDHYGNEIVFDGTDGDEHIRINSPHHESVMVLGRSLTYTTNSDKNAWTFGNSSKATLGSAAALTVGASASATLGANAALFGGVNLGVAIGANIGITAGANFALNWSTSFSVNYGKSFAIDKQDSYTMGAASYTKHANENITIDSEKTTWIIAGSQDHTFLEMDDKKILLSYGLGQSYSLTSESALKAAAIGRIGFGIATGLLGAATAVAGSFVARSATAKVDGDHQNGEVFDQGSAFWPSIVGVSTGAVATIAAATGWGVYSRKMAKKLASEKKPPVHDSPKSVFLMDDEGVWLSCAKIDAQEAQVWVKKVADDEIVIAGKGGTTSLSVSGKNKTISLTAPTEVTVDTATTNFKKGKIVHKNITISE